MEAIIHRKEENASKATNLQGYNQGLEMQIKNAFERLKNSPELAEKRNAHKQMACLMALRTADFVRELEYRKFGFYL